MQEVFGFLKAALDAHTLGLNSAAELLRQCGYRVLLGDAELAQAVNELHYEAKRRLVMDWLRRNQISKVGLSYRLDPLRAVRLVGYFVKEIKNQGLLAQQGGPIRGIYFAGLPQACTLVQKEERGLVVTFAGGESVGEVLRKLGVPPGKIPKEVGESSSYDDWRLNFGRELILSQRHRSLSPRPWPSYPQLGTKEDTLEKRLAALPRKPFLPLMRAHVGPYSASLSREEAVRKFLGWVRELAGAGFLDILSIGTSQLTQSNFGEDWAEKPNGGGVPLNSPQEYQAVWEQARPLLLRTYAGTKNIPQMAALHERTLNICWHALSFWWFNQLDGRGPYDLLENLKQHQKTLAYIAKTGKPFEANVSHHFAFRGADDVTYLVSAYLAAKLAKKMGIKTFILQNMLNTPRFTWGLQDLAKSRALLALLGELEDANFRILFQPRAGLDYFRPDLEEAQAQLAAVTALMDDVDPGSEESPPLIHVVSYSEGLDLASPSVINESIQITRAALEKYRELRRRGSIEDLSKNLVVEERRQKLFKEARQIIAALETHLVNPYSAAGFYLIFTAGFLPTPFLWNKAPQYERARQWRTKPEQGGVIVVDEQGRPVGVETRIAAALENLQEARYTLAQQE